MPNSSRLNRIKRGPLFSGSWAGDPADPGFGLVAADMPRISKHLAGCAVTVEHAGLLDAISTLDRIEADVSAGNLLSALRSQPAGAKHPVGVVVEANPNASVILHIDSAMPAVAALVRGGALRGLSLTTIADNGGPAMPVEMTLCADPARGPGAIIGGEYKFVDGSLVNLKMEAAAATPVVEKTPLELALESVPEKDREAIVARLQEYETKRQADTKELEELSTALRTRDTMLGKTETDRQVLLAQFDVLKQRLESVDADVNLEGCREALSTADRSQQMNDFAVGRIIEACSRAFQNRTAVAAPAEEAANKKRKTAASSDGEELRNLLRSNF